VMRFHALSFGLRIEVMKPSFEFLSYNNLDDSTLTKLHVGDSHFLVVHDGNVRGANALILRLYLRRKMPLMVL
jgi:hypothetical protein